MSRLARHAGAVLLLGTAGLASSAVAATAADERLLAATDLFAAAPAELRLELVFRSGAAGARVPIELWRKGDELALVRFLLPKDRGKFVVRRGGSFWFLAPGAKKPVQLAPALAPSGGSALDDLLAVRPSRDYTIAAVEDVRGLVTFDLVAKPGTPGSAKVRWVADRAKRLPVRAEFRTKDDKVTRLVEFKSWKNAGRLEPDRLIAKDVARGGQPLEVEIVALEARSVDAKLFDLEDGSARAALPPPAERAGDSGKVTAKP